MLTKEVINQMNVDELRNHVCKQRDLIDRLVELHDSSSNVENSLRDYIEQLGERDRIMVIVGEERAKLFNIEHELLQKYFPPQAPFQAANAKGWQKTLGETNG